MWGWEQLETWYPQGTAANSAARPSSPRSGIKDAPCVRNLDHTQKCSPTMGSVTTQDPQHDALWAVEAGESSRPQGCCPGAPTL